MYNLITCKVVITRDVLFRENARWDWRAMQVHRCMCGMACHPVNNFPQHQLINGDGLSGSEDTLTKSRIITSPLSLKAIKCTQDLKLHQVKGHHPRNRGS